MRTSGKNRLKSWRDKKSVLRCTSWSRPSGTPAVPSDSYMQWPITRTNWSLVSGGRGWSSSSTWPLVHHDLSFQNPQGSTPQSLCLKSFWNLLLRIESGGKLTLILLREGNSFSEKRGLASSTWRGRGSDAQFCAASLPLPFICRQPVVVTPVCPCSGLNNSEELEMMLRHKMLTPRTRL